MRGPRSLARLRISTAIFLVVVLVSIVVILAGCGLKSSNETTYVRTPDGRNVLCIWKRHGYAGGLSCDWEGSRK